MSDSLYYSQTHEWARVSRDVATIGITDFAAQQLSDLIHLELPKPKTQLKQNEPLGEVESVKTVSDINSPLSGEVIERNDSVLTDLNKVNADPFGAGWMVKVKVANPAELKNLLTEAAYKKLCETDAH
ncbi:MAG: glycine cleavage system protein GcvH [Planctomycetes bacterium]|nr:glycine cleavage system protein GcvH [Planctomycetota bacterium]